MIEGKKILAVIPARGGSKGLPRKNILPIGGKPLIAWSIEKAKKSKFSSYDTMLKSLVNELEKNGLNKIEYVEIRDEKTLKKFSEFSDTKNVRFRIFIAIRIGKVRLIDNLRIS